MSKIVKKKLTNQELEGKYLKKVTIVNFLKKNRHKKVIYTEDLYKLFNTNSKNDPTLRKITSENFKEDYIRIYQNHKGSRRFCYIVHKSALESYFCKRYVYHNKTKNNQIEYNIGITKSKIFILNMLERASKQALFIKIKKRKKDHSKYNIEAKRLIDLFYKNISNIKAKITTEVVYLKESFNKTKIKYIQRICEQNLELRKKTKEIDKIIFSMKELIKKDKKFYKAFNFMRKKIKIKNIFIRHALIKSIWDKINAVDLTEKITKRFNLTDIFNSKLFEFRQDVMQEFDFKVLSDENLVYFKENHIFYKTEYIKQKLRDNGTVKELSKIFTIFQNLKSIKYNENFDCKKFYDIFIKPIFEFGFCVSKEQLISCESDVAIGNKQTVSIQEIKNHEKKLEETKKYLNSEFNRINIKDMIADFIEKKSIL